MSIFEKINVEVSVVLGGQTMPIHQLLRMGRGAVIELDKSADADVEILANELPIARGQVVLKGERVTISITEVLVRPASYRRVDDVVTV